jgi:hypothetical protein
MGSKAIKTPATDETALQDEQIATHQEAIPLPYLAGTRKIAVRWIGPAERMLTNQSTDNQVGKK